MPATGVMLANSNVTGVIATDGSTFQTGDIINGNATSNAAVTIASTAAAAPLVQINSLQGISFRTLADQTINATLFNNVGTVGITGSQAVLTVTGSALASTYAVAASSSGIADGLSVALRAGDITGTSNTINFAVAGAGSSAGANTFRTVLTSASTGVEGIAIATTGSNFFSIGGSTAAATDSVTLTLTGAGVNDVQVRNGGLATTSNINASALTGALSLDVGNNLTSNDTISGGSGTSDTLRVLTGGAATGVNVTGFETLRLSAGSTGTTLFAAAPNFSTLRVNEGAGTSATLGVVGAPATILYRGDATNTAAGTAAVANWGSLIINTSYAGTADVVSINVNNGGVAKNAGVNYGVGALTANGIETANFIVADISGTGATTFGEFGSNTLQNVTYTTSGRLATDAISGGTNTIASISYAGVTAADAGAGSVIAAGVSASSLASGATITAINTGTRFTLGGDQNAGTYTFIGGRGNDLADFSALAGATDNAILQGIAGNNTLTGGAGTDIIQGGTGNDTLTGGAGADILTGGAGADRLRYTTAATSVAANGANTDFITDFTTAVDQIQLFASAGAGGLLNGVTITAATAAFVSRGVNVVDATAVANIGAVFAAINVNAAFTDAGTAFAGSAVNGTGTGVKTISFATGAAAGTYLVVNDAAGGFQAATDLVIGLGTGVRAFAVATDIGVFA